MKRTLTSIAAAALAIGTMAPAAFAATTSASNTLKAAGGKTITLDGSNLYTGVQAGTALDAGQTTTYFPIYYLQQTLTKAGYTNTYNSTTKTWDITLPGVNASSLTVAGGVGTGNAAISINGTVVKKFNAQWAKDLAGGANAQVTTYFPLYYLGNVLSAAGFGGAWNGTSGTFSFTHANVAPAVKAVKGLNATQVEVDFTQAVDSKDGVDITKYSLNGTHPAASGVSLSADGKTATLTFASYSDVNVTNGAFVVSPIATAANPTVKTTTYAGLFTFADTTAPSVSSVTSETNSATATSATVNFSEPIQSLGTVKIDGVVYSPSSFTPGGTSAVFGSSVSLDASTQHTIQFIGLTDEAGNVTANTTFTFSVKKDTMAPTATLSTQGDHTILVTFSKPMNDTSVTTAFDGTNKYVKDELLGDVTYSAAKAVAGTNNTQYTITVGTSLYKTNVTSRTLNVVFPASLQDYLGNAFVAASQKVTLTQDTVKPAITGVSYTADANGNVTDILVKVSEGVLGKSYSITGSNLTLVTQDGVLVDPTTFLGGLKSASAQDGDTTLDFAATSKAPLTGKYAFTFAAGFVSDTAQAANTSNAASFTVDFGQPTASTSFAYKSIDSTTKKDTIKVDFGTAVKGGAVSGSATDLNNYTLNGTVLPAGTTIYLDGTQNVATITLPAGSIAKDDLGAVFTINNVQSLAGATVKPVTTTVSAYDNTAPVLKSAQVIGDTILLTYNEALTDPTLADASADYTITVGGVTLTNATIASAKVSGNTKEVLLTVTPASGSNWDNTKTVTVTTAGTDIKDASTLTNPQQANVVVTAN